ncbi:MAG: HAD hydrolase-like protein [Desulfurococcaceae archaeon]
MRTTPCGEGRTVVFDLYGTLVDWKYSIRSFIELYVSPDAVGRFFTCDIREILNYRPYKQILKKCLLEVAGNHSTLMSSELVEAFILTFAKSPPFPDTVYGLKVLRKRGFKLAVLSNTDRDLVEITLNGFRELLDYVITAEDVRAYKPSLEAFLNAYRLLGVSTDRVVHVSAYPQYDLEPANKLGTKTVLVDRGLGYSWPIKVKNLLELPRVLEEFT